MKREFKRDTFNNATQATMKYNRVQKLVKYKIITYNWSIISL